MLTLSPAEDPLRIRIGINTENLEVLRAGVDRGIEAGAIVTSRLVSRYDGTALLATADELDVAEGDEDMHYFEFNVATLRIIKRRLLQAMVGDSMAAGILTSQMPPGSPEELLHDALNDAEGELRRMYEQAHGEPYPEERPAVLRYPQGGY